MYTRNWSFFQFLCKIKSGNPEFDFVKRMSGIPPFSTRGGHSLFGIAQLEILIASVPIDFIKTRTHISGGGTVADCSYSHW